MLLRNFGIKTLWTVSTVKNLAKLISVVFGQLAKLFN